MVQFPVFFEILKEVKVWSWLFLRCFRLSRGPGVLLPKIKQNTSSAPIVLAPLIILWLRKGSTLICTRAPALRPRSLGFRFSAVFCIGFGPRHGEGDHKETNSEYVKKPHDAATLEKYYSKDDDQTNFDPPIFLTLARWSTWNSHLKKISNIFEIDLRLKHRRYLNNQI